MKAALAAEGLSGSFGEPFMRRFGFFDILGSAADLL
jgi:hypothetical protein